MKLFEEFELYEDMWSLLESRADTQILIDFAGEDLANRFLKIKHRLKSPENDLYYWIKHSSVDALEQAVSDVENTASATKLRKELGEKGAKLVCETEHWLVYHITTYEASRKYGRDTMWCITGINGYGDQYWYKYTDAGVKFWFFITKDNYDPRGFDSKFALSVLGDKYEVYNQQDTKVKLQAIPYIEEVEIPGLDLGSLTFGLFDVDNNTCAVCACIVEHPYDVFDHPYLTLDGTPMCSDCLAAYINTPAGFKDFFLILAYHNVSEYNITKFLKKVNLTQAKVDEVINKWLEAKKNHRLGLNAIEIMEAEDSLICDLGLLGFTVNPEIFN